MLSCAVETLAPYHLIVAHEKPRNTATDWGKGLLEHTLHGRVVIAPQDHLHVVWDFEVSGEDVELRQGGGSRASHKSVLASIADMLTMCRRRRFH